MKNRTTLQFRQQFSQILDSLNADSEPIVIIKNNKPIAAVISYEIFQRRFMKIQDKSERLQILERFQKSAKPAPVSTAGLLRELRYGKS